MLEFDSIENTLTNTITGRIVDLIKANVNSVARYEYSLSTNFIAFQFHLHNLCYLYEESIKYFYSSIIVSCPNDIVYDIIEIIINKSHSFEKI